MFNEDNTTEQMIISTLVKNGWEYIPADQLERDEKGLTAVLDDSAAKRDENDRPAVFTI